MKAAAAYLAKMPVAVAGQSGPSATFAAACKLVEFGLAERETWPLLLDYNGRCLPPWTESDLRHKLSDAFKKARPNPKFVATQPRKIKSPSVFDWQKHVASFTEQDTLKLAEWRGFSPDFVRWLHAKSLVGTYEGRVAFPNHNAAGQVVSCHVHLASGNWMFKPEGQSTAPLFFGDVAAAGFVLAFESQWDAFAVMDKLGWHATNGLPDAAVFITRGSGNGKLAKDRFSPDAIVYAFEQNEAPKKGETLSSAEKWTLALAAAAGCKVLRVATPAPHKDANDWTRAGGTKDDIEAARLAAKPVRTAPPPAQSTAPAWHLLFDLEHPKHDDRAELLRHRYLCQGGGLLLCGPTGIGKSSLSMQAMILWAIGRPCFGIEPARPLKSLLIQAENDEGDIAEMRDGIIAGLKLTADEIALARQNTIVAREDERTSTRFLLETVEPLLAAHKPDLLWIDPALAYLGGEASSQKDVGGFLRNGLNPLLHKYGCAAVVVHHVNKPPTGRNKPDWKAGDFAYLGSGSAEWANWARAVLALRSIGSHAIFELQAAKRGGRLGWREADGKTKSYVKYLAHATEPGRIYWQEAMPEETDKGGRPKTADVEEVFDLLPPEGLIAGDWQQAALTECGIKESTFHNYRRALRDAKRIVKSKITDKWQPYLKP